MKHRLLQPGCASAIMLVVAAGVASIAIFNLKRREVKEIKRESPGVVSAHSVSRPITSTIAFLAANCDFVKDDVRRFTDVWNNNRLHLRQWQGALDEDQLRSSLLTFVASERERHLGPLSDGEIGWLAFCVSDAYRRSSIETSKDDVVGYYALLDESVCDELQHHLVDVVPQGHRSALTRLIFSEIQALRERILTRTKELNRDLLFPGLKRILLEDEKKSLLSHYTDPKFYPRYEDPEDFMISADELYASRTRRFLRGLDGLHLAYITIIVVQQDLKEDVNNYPLVGRGSGGGYTGWPLWYEIAPMAESTESSSMDFKSINAGVKR